MAFALAFAACRLAAAQSPVTACDWRAESWELQEGQLVLVGVQAVCGDLTFLLETARLGEQELVGRGRPAVVSSPDFTIYADEVSSDLHQVRASSGCISAKQGEAVRCCGEEILLVGDRWTMTSARCTTESGLAYRFAQVSGTPEGLWMEKATFLEPLDLPYPLGHLDSRGRAAGFLMPVVGYRTQRGGGIRLNWYQPMGGRADLTAGLFAETAGAIGVASTVRLASPHRRQPSTVRGFALYDSTTDWEWRWALASDLTWSSGSGHSGTIVLGELRSDSAVGRDFSVSTLERDNPVTHLSLAGWMGSSLQRSWVQMHLRGIGMAPVGVTDTPVNHYAGVVPSIGYGSNLSMGRLGQLTGRIEAQRLYVGGGIDPDSLYALQLLAGYQLFGLRFDGLSFLPGAWIAVGSQFTGPQAVELYQRHALHLVIGADLSSPWWKGTAAAGHLVDLGASARLELFRDTWTRGTLEEAFETPVSTGPLSLEVRADQSLVTSGFRLELPLCWRGHLEEDRLDSHLVAEAGLELRRLGIGLRMDQKTAFDTERTRFAYWMGSIAVGFGRSAAAGDGVDSTPASARPVQLGGRILLLHSDTDLGDTYRILSSGQLSRFHLRTWQSGPGVAGGWFQTQLGPIGLSGTLEWPLEPGDWPDLGGALWLGMPWDFHLAVRTALFSEGSVACLVTLAQGSFTPEGPWSATAAEGGDHWP
ncbi:MAG: hypothetical protein JW797_07025 [Bradymonadales bacterium]|nr:hypothetical protein [Bradymonadales bacterium]